MIAAKGFEFGGKGKKEVKYKYSQAKTLYFESKT